MAYSGRNWLSLVVLLLEVLVELVLFFVAASHNLELGMDALPKGRKNIDKVAVRTNKSVVKVLQNGESCVNAFIDRLCELCGRLFVSVIVARCHSSKLLVQAVVYLAARRRPSEPWKPGLHLRDDIPLAKMFTLNKNCLEVIHCLPAQKDIRN